MKTYFRDYSAVSQELVTGCDELEEIINNRQEKFMLTTEYQEAKAKAMEALKKVEEMLPQEHKAIMAIEDTFFYMECICYSMAYRDGMTDLMAAMTFNKLAITKCEYVDFSNKEVRA